MTSVDPAIDVAVFDAGVRVAGELEGGARTEVEAGGRTLEVRADSGAPANVWPAVVVAAGAVLASVALALALRPPASLRARPPRSSPSTSTTERTQAMRLADLGRDLTAVPRPATSSSRCSARVLPDVTSADEVSVAFVDGELLRPAVGGGLVPLDTHLPTTEAVRRAEIVTVDDLDAYQRAAHRSARRRPSPPAALRRRRAADRHERGGVRRRRPRRGTTSRRSGTPTRWP